MSTDAAPLHQWLDDGQLPNDASLVLLDDLNSSSDFHISTIVQRAIDRPVRPFSYSRSRYRYLCKHTWMAPIRSHARRLSGDYLPVPSGHTVIPVGFGIGALVALLGTKEWLLEQTAVNMTTARLLKRVPDLVLVFPAIGLKQNLLHALYTTCINDERLVRLEPSPVIQELSSPEDYAYADLMHSIDTSLRVAHGVGITIYVAEHPHLSTVQSLLRLGQADTADAFDTCTTSVPLSAMLKTPSRPGADDRNSYAESVLASPILLDLLSSLCDTRSKG